jgi:ATP-dependent DNA helicase RecG
MYRDRLEITNSGGLYGRIAIDKLGKVRPETRNAVLANMLELLRVTENRYSGIPTMRSECAKLDLPAPVFACIHGEFKVTMRNDYSNQSDSLSDAIMQYCDMPRSRQQLVDFSGKSKNYVMTQIVLPLVNSGRLKLTIPEKPQSSKQRYMKSK